MWQDGFAGIKIWMSKNDAIDDKPNWLNVIQKHPFLRWSLIVNSPTNRIELVTRPTKKEELYILKKMVGRRLPPLPSVGDILRMYNIQAKKALSQNFILDPRILDSIARHASMWLNSYTILLWLSNEEAF